MDAVNVLGLLFINFHLCFAFICHFVALLLLFLCVCSVMFFLLSVINKPVLPLKGMFLRIPQAEAT